MTFFVTAPLPLPDIQTNLLHAVVGTADAEQGLECIPHIDRLVTAARPNENDSHLTQRLKDYKYNNQVEAWKSVTLRSHKSSCDRGLFF